MRTPSRFFRVLSVAIAFGGVVSAGVAQTSPQPYGTVPNARQVKNAEREFYAFCHFTTNTFTGREWGDGTESPTLFNPSQFDADQIVGAVKAAGMKGFILTAKHHDGFCLWPTKTTSHNISASPYKNGQGDIVREFADACRKAGLAFGIYVSPWDRNNEHYGTSKYVTDVFREQIRELCTNYGPLFEFWFDGANGGTGGYGSKTLSRRTIDRATYYGWDDTWKIVQELQPDAVIFSDVGPGMRWVGNESGYANDPCRATITYPKNVGPGSNIDRRLLGSGLLGGEQWVQAEVDVSIRPGWFWHAAQNSRVRSPANLMKIYLESVGRGATLNLNVPPDRRGRVHENDVASLATLGEHLRKTFEKNLAADAKLIPSNVRGGSETYGAGKLLDADIWSAWVTDDTVTTPELVVKFPEPRAFNLVSLREDIRLGLRVEGVVFEAWVGGAWKGLAKAESIGSRRLWRVEKTTTDKVRLRVTKCPVAPAFSDLGIYLEPELAEVSAGAASAQARAKAGWKVLSVSAEASGGEARRAIDGNPRTFWHTHPRSGEHPLPQEIAVDMGAVKVLAGFTYLPRQDGTVHGMVDRYTFYVSTDGKIWRQVSSGEFGNLRANPVEQTVSFEPVPARYFKFVATHALEKNHAVVAELGVIEQ